MKKRIILPLLLALSAAAFAQSCATEDIANYQPAENEKLTDMDRFALFDYARNMAVMSKKKMSDERGVIMEKMKTETDADKLAGLKERLRRLNIYDNLSEKDIDFMIHNDPAVRMYYTGPKRGKITLIWDINEMTRISVTAKGDLVITDFFNSTPEWQFKVYKNTRDARNDPARYNIKK